MPPPQIPLATSVVNYAVWGFDSSESIYGSFVGAKATATTIAIDMCPVGGSPGCSSSSALITVGPWAMPTPPPEASTGVYDMTVSYPIQATEEIASLAASQSGNKYETFTAHCEITSTSIATVPIAARCTARDTDENGKRDISTLKTPEILEWRFSMVPITITGGLGKLAAATPTPTAN